MSSTWELENKGKSYPKLEGNLDADVVIVGGGLAGVWCAYLLSAAGEKVVVLEKDKLGQGATAYTTAFITQALDTPLVELREMFGLDVAEDAWRSHAEAVQLIENVVKREGIDCEFTRSSVFMYANTQDDYKKLVDEHMLADNLGFETMLHKKLDIGLKHRGVLEIPMQAKYHPLKFFKGLVEAAERHGTVFYENTTVEEVVGNAPVKVVTSDGHIATTQDVVIATYNPLGNPRATRLKKGMYVSYVHEYKIPKDLIPEGMYIDQHNPYHYTRVDPIDDETSRMIVGGEDHRSELPISEDKNYKALREYARETFPALRSRPVRKWKGGIMEPSDGLALIGETTPHHFVATAFSGNGMTYSALAAWIISDLMLGSTNPYADIYDPRRKLEVKAVLYKARDYTVELFGGAVKNIFK